MNDTTLDYAALARKNNPFEGLSARDAKKLAVYFYQFAPAVMTQDELLSKYGYFPAGADASGEIPFAERMALMREVGRELEGAGGSVADELSAKFHAAMPNMAEKIAEAQRMPPRRSKLGVGCFVILAAIGILALLYLFA